jgi:hypothetical protein
MAAKKTDKLLHVQRKAIRELLFSKVDEKDLVRRYRQVVKQETSKLEEALKRADKNTLIKIVSKCPEITEEDINECFEEYRYSRRPNFRLFLLYPFGTKITSEKLIASCGKSKGIQKLNQALTEINFSKDNLKNITILDQTVIDKETMEFSFSYQERYNYIDPDTEDSNHIFELKYGFLWINMNERFLSISVPNDTLAPILADAVNKAFDTFSTSINITEDILKSVFSKESMKRTSLFHPNPPPGYPEKISLADAKMGEKVEHLKNYEGYQVPNSVYIERIEDEFFSTLGVNCSKGKIYLTRQLKASQMRNWGLWRIKQIMSYIHGVYENDDIDALFTTIGIEGDEELKHFASTKEERDAILALLKAVIKCKKKRVKSFKLLEYNAESLFKALKKHTTAIFEPYCDECNHYTEVVCQCCGHSEITQLQVKKREPVVYCPFCHEQMNLTNLECIEGHKIKVSSWYDGVLFKPLSNLSELIANLINKYFKDVGFSLSEEYFYIQNNELHYSDTTATKVMYNITEIDQFRNVWDRNITEKRREELKEVFKIITEKCSRHSNEACRACQDEKSILCIMKPFVTFTNHQLHPHHGQEFGDVSFNIDLPGLEGATFVGIAKSYDKTTVTTSSKLGREMLEQFVSKCIDERVHVLGLICAANIDQGLIALCQDLARKYGKKIVMWTHEELLLAIDFAIDKYKLKVTDVKKQIEEDIKKRQRQQKAS